MQQVYYQILTAITCAIINSFWQVAILYLLYLCVTKIYHLSANQKYNLLATTQLISLVAFIFSIYNYYVNGLKISATNLINIEFNVINTKIFVLIAIVYLFMLCVFLLQLFIQTIFGQHTSVQHNISSYLTWTSFVSSTATQLNISKKITLQVLNSNIVPFTKGFIKPLIVVPLAALNHLSAKEFEAILLHELAHIKRNDYLINIFLQLTQAVLCFNPLTKYIHQQIEIEREICCDEIVVNFPYTKTVYANALLQIATLNNTYSNNYLTSLFAVNNNFILKNRIEKILAVSNITINKMVNKYKAMLAVIMCGLIFFNFIQYNTTIAISTSHKNQHSILANNFFQKENQQLISSNKTTTTVVIDNNTKTTKSKAIKNTLATAKHKLVKEEKTTVDEFVYTENEITKNNILNFVNYKNEDALDSSITNNITILPTIHKQNNTSIQQFLIPATSQQAAAIITVTTTIKEDGKKQYVIEIENGKGRIE